jgi:hypothetical protein
MVRAEELKHFCDFAGNNYAKLLEYGTTRFSSLGPSIHRILSLLDGLRSYFISQEKGSVAKIVLRSLFEIMVVICKGSSVYVPNIH